MRSLGILGAVALVLGVVFSTAPRTALGTSRPLPLVFENYKHREPEEWMFV